MGISSPILGLLSNINKHVSAGQILRGTMIVARNDAWCNNGSCAARLRREQVNLALRFLRELRPYMRTMIVVGILTIANAGLALLVPRIIGDFINALNPQRPRPVNLPLVFIEILGLSIISGAAGYF
jgi:hypothetical protein